MGRLSEVSGPPVESVSSPRWIFERIEEWATRFPDRFAFAVDHDGRIEKYGYADVLAEADTIATGLTAIGIQAGDRVAILMENIPQWVFALLGAMRLGVITVPLPTTLPETSLRIIVQHSECKMVFFDPQNEAKARTLGIPLWDHAFAKGKPQGQVRATTSGEDTSILMYTSGTTGDPKGVQLTMNNLILEIQGVAKQLDISSEHRILSVLPFSHVLPLIANGLGPLCLGAGVIFLSSISPQRIVDAFHRHRITFFICVPQFFYVLHKKIFSGAKSQSFPLRTLFNTVFWFSRSIESTAVKRILFAKVHKTIGPDLRLLASGGSRFDERIAQDLSALGYTVLQAYGLTETTAAVTATPQNANRIGSVGKPLPGVTIRIDSPNGDGIGEVWIKGPLLMKGYYKDDVKTMEVIKNGWLHTGDLGFIHPDGSLFITGRIKDVIVLANGKNVYPEEIEAHYMKSPFIKEMCVLGVSANGDGPVGETLHAVIVPDMDVFRSKGETTIAETVRFEMENLSKEAPSYQRVHSFVIRNELLPRTVTRKLKRFEIQAEEAARAKRGPASQAGEDHPRLKAGIGAVIAEIVRRMKPQSGVLTPATNLELDLGFDSLARVELLGFIESRLGCHIDEQQAARIFTLGELLEAFETSRRSDAMVGRSWKEILDSSPSGEAYHYIFRPRRILNPLWFTLMRTLKAITKLFWGLRFSGLENIPGSGAFILCPNHESFLDGPMLLSIMPRRVIYNVFILGYSDYWNSPLSSRVAKLCNIVAIDPNASLISAMQIGAMGLRRGKILLVFPEGTRSIDGRVAEFKKGAAIISRELGVPIVPVGIRGTFESWPRSGSLKFHPVEFVVGRPIIPRDYDGVEDPYSAITEKLRTDVRKLCADDERVSARQTSQLV